MHRQNGELRLNLLIDELEQVSGYFLYLKFSYKLIEIYYPLTHRTDNNN